MIIAEYGDVFPPELDGVGAVIRSYCEQFTAMGDECYYIAPENKSENRKFGFRTMLYAGFRFPNEPYRVGVPFLDVQYRRNVRDIPFDVIHSHTPFSAGLEARRVAKRLGVPLVTTFHSKYYDDFLEKTGSRLLARLGVRILLHYYNRCDEVWAVNGATAEVLRSYGYKRPIRIMPNGTDPTEASAEAIASVDEAYALYDKRVLLFVGQMNWKKNIRAILDAFRLMLREEPTLRLLLVGQGASEEEIRSYINELGITNAVIMTGHIADRERLMAIFARAEALIFPSLYDNAPMVVREAAAVGTPTVLLRGSCAAEGFEDGVNAVLCENTPEAIAAGAFRAMDHSAEIGEGARSTILVPWRSVVSRVRARYAELIEQKKK